MRRLLLGTVVLVSACAHRPATGILILHATPPDARVLLDDRYIGSAGALSTRPIRLNAGRRRLELSADGHYSARREAEVPPNGRLELSVELHPVPDGMRGD